MNFSGDKMGVRKHLYKQFGAGTGGEIHHKERHYEKGMPEPGQVAFPKGVDMPKKLRELEGRRLYFYKMCEPAKRNTYAYCQETKLVRIVLDTIGPEYKNTITRVLDLVKVTKMISNAGSGSEDGEVPDAYDRSFSDEWLPSWKLLQASLISEYRIKMKAIEEKAEEKAEKKKLPVAVGGFKEVICYACGGPHKKGDPSCTAGPFDVHSSAPAEWKQNKKIRNVNTVAKMMVKKEEMPNLPSINAPEKRSTAGILTLERARAEMERSAISCMRKVKGKVKEKERVEKGSMIKNKEIKW
jgi:hypothetical protein